MVEHQAAAFELARRVQRATAMVVAARYAARAADPMMELAATCQAMRYGLELTGARPTGGYYGRITELGAIVADDRFPGVALEHPQVAMAGRS